MKFELVELTDFTGPKVAFYSVILDGEEIPLYERFQNENVEQYKQEIDNIASNIDYMAMRVGAEEYFFTPFEGNVGDGVCAMFDDPDKNLRLYCIRYSKQTVILGGGGFKPKDVKALQEVPKLTTENYLMRDVAKQIKRAILDEDLMWDGQFFDGYVFPPDEEDF